MGNQTIEKVTRNALAVARVARITGVPFAAGCARPLVREIETGSSIRSESGLDGPGNFPYSSARISVLVCTAHSSHRRLCTVLVRATFSGRSTPP